MIHKGPYNQIANWVSVHDLLPNAAKLSNTSQTRLSAPVFRTTIRSTKWAILNLGVGMMMQDYCGFAMDLANGAGKLHTARVGPSSFGMYDIQSHMMPLHLHALSLACILPYFLTETILQLKSKCKRFILPYGSIHLCRHDIS